MVVVSLLNLAVAGGMYYAAWWRVDPFLYITMMKKMPIDMPAGFGSAGFFVARPQEKQGVPARIAANGDEESVRRNENGDATSGTAIEVETSGPRWSGKTAQIVIPVAAYGWLTLATAGAWALALAGGSGIRAIGGRWLRWFGMILALGLVAGLAWSGFKVWSEYRFAYKPDHLRIGMGGLVLLSTAIGMTVGRRRGGLSRLAAALVIVAGTGSAAGMWLWSRCDALEPGQASAVMMALVFVVHSVWGWVLWPLSRRV